MAFRLLPNGIIECDTFEEAMQMQRGRGNRGNDRNELADTGIGDLANQIESEGGPQARPANGGQGNGGQGDHAPKGDPGSRGSENEGTRHAGGDILSRVLNRHKEPGAPRDPANQAGDLPMGRESQDEMTGTEDIIPAGGVRSARPQGNVEGRTTNPRGGDNPGTRTGAAKSWEKARKVAKKQGRTDIAKVRQELAAAKNQ